MAHSYSVAIRTLGKAGEKYQQTLDSLKHQTIKPDAIIIYIAESYSIPKETIGEEKYIYVPKGMVSQRALQYDEIESEYILFLDDDVYLPEDSVERLFKELELKHADVISPDVFNNAERHAANKIMMAISGRMFPRYFDRKWGYKVMRNAGYSYNANPLKGTYLSNTNAGPCFLCKKSTFLSMKFQDELWVEDMPYALGEDQVLFYKLHLMGYKVLTSYDSGIVHLDAGTTLRNLDKEKNMIYCDFRFKTIFWHRFIFKTHNFGNKIIDIFAILYTFTFSLITSLLKFRKDILSVKVKGIRDGISFIISDTYRSIPPVLTNKSN